MQKFTKNHDSQISDVEYYICKHDNEKQERLFKIRQMAKEAFKDADERIYYGIPTIEKDGKVILQYAAYKKHISILAGKIFISLLKEKYPQYNYTDYTVVFPDNQVFPNQFLRDVLEMLSNSNGCC